MGITQRQHTGTSPCSLWPWIPWVDPHGPVLPEEQLEELFLQGISSGTHNSCADPNFDAGGRFLWGLVQMKGFQGCQIDSLGCKGHSEPRQTQDLTDFWPVCSLSVDSFPVFPVGCFARVDFSLSCRGESFLFA